MDLQTLSEVAEDLLSELPYVPRMQVLETLLDCASAYPYLESALVAQAVRVRLDAAGTPGHRPYGAA